MQYGEYAFAVDPKVPVILTLNPSNEVLIGQRNALSTHDINAVLNLYGLPLIDGIFKIF